MHERLSAWASVSRIGSWLTAVAIVWLVVGLAAVPFIPTEPCLGPGDPTPGAALVTLLGLVLAALFGLGGVIQVLMDASGRLRSALVFATVVTLVLTGTEVGVAFLALARTRNWSCAGG